ncbi:hypothetical protein [Nesterenkonia populi]
MLPIAIYLALAPLLVAAVIVACLWLPGPRKGLPQVQRLVRGSRPDSAVLLALGASAGLILVHYFADGLLPRWAWADPLREEYRWWTHAEMLLGASVILVCVLVLLRVFRNSPAARVAPSRPRTLRSFASKGQISLLVATTVAILGLVAFAGAASSPNSEGIYRWLTIDPGGETSAATVFFGWAYGIPVAGAALLLVALVLAALHVNAARPFFQAQTVSEEEVSRSTLSTLILWFSTGVMLATLARALGEVASSGGSLAMQELGLTWESSLAALSTPLTWASYASETVAYVLLLLVVTVALRPRNSAALADRGSAHGQGLGSRG